MAALPEVLQNLLSKSDLLIVFLGMFILVWRALSIAHDLSKLALQWPAQAGQVPAAASPVAAQPVAPAKHGAPALAQAPAIEAPAPEDTVIDQGLVDFIKEHEGFSAKAYWDYKQWSIGYGTKAKSADEVIDQAEAETRLRAEIARADKLVTDFASGLPKGAHQALIDLTYNAGSGWEQGSLGRAVKAQKWDTVKADILLYNHAGGQVNEGLTKRRQAEVTWFDNPL